MNKPKEGPIDFIPLLKACKEYVDFINSNEGYRDNDHSQYIFEAAMTCIYGKDFWEWHNSKFVQGI